MAAAILQHFKAGTEVALIEGTGGVLDVTAFDQVVYSKKALGIPKSEVNEEKVCQAIEAAIMINADRNASGVAAE